MSPMLIINVAEHDTSGPRPLILHTTALRLLEIHCFENTNAIVNVALHKHILG